VERERAERRRIEQEAAAEREQRAAAERERVAAAERAREAAEAEKREAVARERAAQRKRNRRTNGASSTHAGGPSLVVSDQFAEFREEYDHVGPGVFRLMPLAAWARTEHPGAGTPEAEAQPPDDLRELMSRLTLPQQVAGVTYASGCRIRRVRVPAIEGAKKERGARPVIVSRRALNEARSNESR
jgi:hypothetical protein